MLQKLFRKPPVDLPRFQQDSSLAEALAQRVSAIEFQPSRGFLKDQWQEKRPMAELDAALNQQQSYTFNRRLSAQHSN